MGLDIYLLKAKKIKKEKYTQEFWKTIEKQDLWDFDVEELKEEGALNFVEKFKNYIVEINTVLNNWEMAFKKKGLSYNNYIIKDISYDAEKDIYYYSFYHKKTNEEIIFYEEEIPIKQEYVSYILADEIEYIERYGASSDSAIWDIFTDVWYHHQEGRWEEKPIEGFVYDNIVLKKIGDFLEKYDKYNPFKDIILKEGEFIFFSY